MDEANRKVVLGLGNLLNRDEGLGVQALDELKRRLGDGARVEMLDGGVLGLNLLMIVEECSHLLVLDAADARREPGTIIELARDAIPLYTGVKMSEHQITFQEVLGLANVRGKLPPHLHLIGVQPADISIGLDLSPEVRLALPEAIDRAVRVLRDWGLAPAVAP